MSTPASSTPPRHLVVGPRGSGKTRRLIAQTRALLDAGVPARRLLIVTFSPRVASQIGAHLSVAEDEGAPGGVWVQTAQRLCARLLRDSQRVVGRDRDVRIISAFERATLLQVAVRQVAADLGPDHPLTPALADTGGLAEMELLLEAVAGQGGTPADLERACRDMDGLVPALDAAVLEGVGQVYRTYRALRERVGGLTYQEVAAEAAAALADPAVAAAMAQRIDYLLIDDLERAEPAQIDVLAHLATAVPVFATLDPAGIISDRAVRSLERARRLLDLDPDQPTEVLTPPPVPSPALAGLRDRLTQASIADTAPPLLPSTVRPIDDAVVVADDLLDTGEATYVARVVRAALDEAPAAVPEGEPDVLILPPTPALHTLILGALRAEGIDVVDIVGGEEVCDPAVRYALAWLRVLVEPGDEQWERVLASPHAGLPPAEAARLRHWAAEKELSLHQALREAARGGCEPLADAARTRCGALVRLDVELRESVHRKEPPSVTLHRLLAREDLVGALLVGPTDTGAAPPDPRGLAGLCVLVRRIEELWRHTDVAEPSLATVLDRLEQGLAHLLEQAEAPESGRVVLADLDAALDWRARVVIVPGLADAFLPRPWPRSRLLSDAALAHLRQHWALPWPADFEAYAAGERRALVLAVAAVRERVVLTRALRYEGQDAPVPSPLLLDALGAARIDAASCRTAGARLDRWTVTHDVVPAGPSAPTGDEPTRTRRGDDLLALAPEEAARNLDTLLYRYAQAWAVRNREGAAAFLGEARALLASADAPVRGRYLTIEDPFGPLPAAPTMLPPGARLPVRAVNEYLTCPRRFFYGTLAAIREPVNGRMHLGMLLSRAVEALLRRQPSPGLVTVEDAEEVLRLLWQGEAVPGADADDVGAEAEAYAGRFGSQLDDAAARSLAQRALGRLVSAERRATHVGPVLATHVSVEVPVGLPDGRTVRVTATVDRISAPAAGAARPALTLVDYRSGASEPTAEKAIGTFLNRKGTEGWVPTDYTLPVLFLGVAGNRAVYAQHHLPPLPIRQLSVVSLGADDGGQPHVCTIEVSEGASGKTAVRLDELTALRDQIAATVLEAAGGPHPPAPRSTFNACAGCAHRFACPGPETAS